MKAAVERLASLERLASDQLQRVRLGIRLLQSEFPEWSAETGHRLRGVAHQGQRICETIDEALAEVTRPQLREPVERVQSVRDELMKASRYALSLLN